MDAYPAQRSQRNQWVLDQRGPTNPVDPLKPYAFFSEQEAAADGTLIAVSTLLLTNRECPWKCVMCDLWRNTLVDTVPRGAIPAQIAYALQRLPQATCIKLYNSGSFFDPRAIPPDDYADIAERVAGFDRVIVECHPALVTEACATFQKMLRGQLEIAIGLETAHPGALAKLNKGMNLAQFSTAARFLGEHGIDLRVFLLVHPPFIEPDSREPWIRRSIDFAFESGAGALSLIPMRAGNGAMDALASMGQFDEPALRDLESALEYGLPLRRGRVFADLWDLERFSTCRHCFDARRSRLQWMNHQQRTAPPIQCDSCGASQ